MANETVKTGKHVWPVLGLAALLLSFLPLWQDSLAAYQRGGLLLILFLPFALYGLWKNTLPPRGILAAFLFAGLWLFLRPGPENPALSNGLFLLFYTLVLITSLLRWKKEGPQKKGALLLPAISLAILCLLERRLGLIPGGQSPAWLFVAAFAGFSAACAAGMGAGAVSGFRPRLFLLIVLAFAGLKMGQGAIQTSLLQENLDRLERQLDARDFDQAKGSLKKLESRNACWRDRELSRKILRHKARLLWRTQGAETALALCHEEIPRFLAPRFFLPKERQRVRDFFSALPGDALIHQWRMRSGFSITPAFHEKWRQYPELERLYYRLRLARGEWQRLSMATATLGFPDRAPELREDLEQAEMPEKEKGHLLAEGWMAGPYDEQGKALIQKRLALYPEDPNGISWMERYCRRKEDKEGWEKWAAQLRRLDYSCFLGAMSYGWQNRGVLWTGLECNPGPYELEVEVRGKAADGEWPRLSIFLGDEPRPLWAGEVRGENWQWVRATFHCDQETRKRLELRFENDFFQECPSGVQDRNLECRQIRLRRLSRD